MGNAVTFGAAGGNDIVNLQYAQNYTKIARKIDTDLDDFLGNDDMSGLYRCNLPGTNNIVPGGYRKATPTAADPAVMENTLFTSTESYIDVKQLVASQANKEHNRYRQYPLSAFTGTLLGVDRDFWYPVEQYLRIQAGTGDKMAFISPAVNDFTNAASITVGSITVNSIYLYLCVEQNMEIIHNIQQAYAAGKLTYSIPYTQAFKTVGSANGQQTNISIHDLSFLFYFRSLEYGCIQKKYFQCTLCLCCGVYERFY